MFNLCFYAILILTSPIFGEIIDNEVEKCNLPDKLKEEIASYAPLVNKISNSILNGKFKGSSYRKLAEFIDRFGSRQTGTSNLEDAIDYMLKRSNEENLENVHGEKVMVPHWVRGKESAVLLHPHHQNLAILGLGSSVGTPPEGITAEAIVINSFDELEKLSKNIKDKIVVFNEDYISYGQAVKYRDYAADRSSKYGAVATLVRSVTPFSLNTPHTGWQDYSGNVTKIPTACITIEDAHMLKRMQNKHKLIINLKMEAKTLKDTTSRNTVVEIKGRKTPEKVVIISGHLDSWDVGKGAMDDGAGAFLSWNSLVILKSLGLRPKRTLRAILWTAEEEGLVGAFNYFKTHEDLKNIDFIMESDEGTFLPLGIEYAGPRYGACVLQEVVKLLTSANATQLKWSTNVGSDITIWINKGIPGASLLNANERYFWYHHSEADTMDVENSDVLDKCTVVWTIASYIMADLSVTIPKNLTYT